MTAVMPATNDADYDEDYASERDYTEEQDYTDCPDWLFTLGSRPEVS
jgi:hypothetical protein